VDGERVEKVDVGVTVTVKAGDPPVGHEFSGWTVNKGEITLKDTASSVTTFVMPDTEVVLTAIFKPKIFSITYDPNGGSGKEEGFLTEYGTAITLGECTFTPPADYVFKCWKVNRVVYNVGDSFVVTGDTVIAPVWRHSTKDEVTTIIVDNVIFPAGKQNPSGVYTADVDAPYNDAEVYWVDVSNGMAMTDKDVFEGGESYRFTFEFSVDDKYYVFADPDTIKATVNGFDANIRIVRNTVAITFDVMAISVEGDIVFDLITHKTDKETVIALYDGSIPDDEIIADIAFGDTDIDMGYSPEILSKEESGCTLTRNVRFAAVATGDYVVAIYAPEHSPILVKVSVEGENVVLENITPSLMGDTTSDCRLNLLDVSLMMKYAAGWDVKCDTVSADVTGDGKINLMDVMNLMKYLVGWDGVILRW